MQVYKTRIITMTTFIPLQTQKLKLNQKQYYNKNSIKTNEYNQMVFKYLETNATDEIMKLRNIMYATTHKLLGDDYKIFINYKKLNLSDYFLDKFEDDLISFDTLYIKSLFNETNKTISYTFYVSLSNNYESEKTTHIEQKATKEDIPTAF